MYCLYMYKLRSSYLGQFILHVGKDVQEASHCVPQSAVCKSQLVQRARALKQQSMYYNLLNLFSTTEYLNLFCTSHVLS